MKEYKQVEIELTYLQYEDIVRTSPGTTIEDVWSDVEGGMY